MSLAAGNGVWVVLHSGSRGVGNALAIMHIKAAQKTCLKAGRELEDRDLAYLVEGDDGFDAYVADMLWAQEYARANRKLMMAAVLGALASATGLGFTPIDAVDCHHNYAEKETHYGAVVWVTRKGATRARQGDRGVIPGSMGDDTCIVSGRGCAESYCSASHGVGRLMSRTRAKKEISPKQLTELMEGRTWQACQAAKPDRRGPRCLPLHRRSHAGPARPGGHRSPTHRRLELQRLLTTRNPNIVSYLVVYI